MNNNAKSISFGTRRGNIIHGMLHVEVPGAVVNITTGLHDAEGRARTLVSISTEDYSGEPSWYIPTFMGGETTHLSVPIVQDTEPSTGQHGRAKVPDIIDLARAIQDFEERFPGGYMHPTFASGYLNSGGIEYSYSSKSMSEGFIYFVSVQDGITKIRNATTRSEGESSL